MMVRDKPIRWKKTRDSGEDRSFMDLFVDQSVETIELLNIINIVDIKNL